MINERERRILEELERRMAAEDPSFAAGLAGGGEWARWRSAWRKATASPVVLLITVLSIAAFALHVSSIGLSFLMWALIGGAAWVSRARNALP